MVFVVYSRLLIASTISIVVILGSKFPFARVLFSLLVLFGIESVAVLGPCVHSSPIPVTLAMRRELLLVSAFSLSKINLYFSSGEHRPMEFS